MRKAVIESGGGGGRRATSSASGRIGAYARKHKMVERFEDGSRLTTFTKRDGTTVTKTRRHDAVRPKRNPGTRTGGLRMAPKKRSK